jgi:hypothetical protein
MINTLLVRFDEFSGYLLKKGELMLRNFSVVRFDVAFCMQHRSEKNKSVVTLYDMRFPNSFKCVTI